MHLKRWITGLVALPFLILLIVAGGEAFFLLVAVASILALREYHKIALSAPHLSAEGVPLLLSYFFAPFILLAAAAGSAEWVLGALAVSLIGLAFFAVVRFDPDRFRTDTLLLQATGILYILLPFALLLRIRAEPEGTVWIFLILAVVFAGDTCAYHIGSVYGRHKLCPKVSPGKTVEGALGGLAGNLLAGALIKGFFLPDLPWAGSLLFFVVAGAAGQLGDLFESQFKRLGNIKDSGHILPGHGGILDRIDALLFAAPVAYLFKQLLII